MTDTTAKIRAKGLDATGITEEVAAQLYAHKGRHIMAIVELQVAERHEKAEGGRRVDLTIEMVEPAEHGGTLDKHLRDLASTVYVNRARTDGQQAIDDSLTPTIEEAVQGAKHLKPHPFLPTDAADEEGSCEVCGLGDNSGPHRAWRMDHPDDEDHPDAAGDEGDEQDNTGAGEQPAGGLTGPFEIPTNQTADDTEGADA